MNAKNNNVLKSLRDSLGLKVDLVQSSRSNQMNHCLSSADIERAVAQANAANEDRIAGLEQQLEEVAAERDQIATENDQNKAQLDRVRAENQTLQKRNLFKAQGLIK
ncbi:hypothetical protein P9112_009873 [Eukaryota sp. TZLM1-RC]